ILKEVRKTNGIPDPFPPVRILDDGENKWLYDGWHRVRAYDRAGFTLVNAIVERGTRRQAKFLSLAANKDHGLRRSNEDKHRAVELYLGDPEWVQHSDRVVAEHCGVDHKTVASIRKQLT